MIQRKNMQKGCKIKSGRRRSEGGRKVGDGEKKKSLCILRPDWQPIARIGLMIRAEPDEPEFNQDLKTGLVPALTMSLSIRRERRVLVNDVKTIGHQKFKF